jgi:hypothetical protein
MYKKIEANLINEQQNQPISTTNRPSHLGEESGGEVSCLKYLF